MMKRVSSRLVSSKVFLVYFSCYSIVSLSQISWGPGKSFDIPGAQDTGDSRDTGGFKISGIRDTRGSRYRGLEIPGVRDIGDSRYQGFEIPGVRDTRGSRYRGFEIPGVRDIGDSRYLSGTRDTGALRYQGF